MSDRDLDVYLDWRGETLLLGRLWARSKGSKETSSFEYDETWLARQDRFSLDPALPLAAGQFHAAELFNAFRDPAPDRWGRNPIAPPRASPSQGRK
jgi:serine/threonine-protein kinase HipA